MKIPTAGRAVALLALLGLAATARADYSYDYVVAPAPASLQIGETFQLNVFIQETATGGDAPRLTGAGNGLFSAAVRVDFGASAAVRILANADVTPNSSEFADTLAAGLIGPGAAGLNEQVPLSSFDPVSGTPLGVGVSRILVGSFRFTAVAAGTAVVTFGDLAPATDDVVAADGFVLDSVLRSASVRFEVANQGAVPEPASFVLLAAGLTGIRIVGRRRRPAA